ncbi:helix-turn-helix domain-containing protein [Ruegeria lacuscaerulensis]|uniref:AraC-like ligand-binding domain-containing protein n=1 Tax=Ruegeria lacuscaerulensis TaxID=55218 RepID=UPI00147F6230|nr:helix-turn-helix domain-containing protein [Ruegeria lacuscaerulensis]
MTSLLSTNSVRRKDRFAFWREAVCDAYVMLDCHCDRPEAFDGEISLNRMSRLSTSFVTGSQQLVRRRQKDVSRASEESFLISLQIAKEGTISQCGRAAHLRPGDFTLYSSTDRYSIDLQDGFRQLVVQIPREDLLAHLPNADQFTGITVSGNSAIGRVAGSSVVQLVEAADTAGEAVQHAMQTTILDLFVTGLASLGETAFELSKPEKQILLRSDAAIQANLRDPSFDRNVLAAGMGMSVRRLTEIYGRDNRSISSTIRKMRLARIADDLRNPRCARMSINEIALRWGFGHHQSLTRNFRAQYGMTPRDYRMRCA